MLDGIRRALKQSQSSASPPAPPRPKRLSILERTLANFLTPSKKGPQPNPDPGSAPISLKYVQAPRAEATGDELRLKAAFSIELRPETDADQVDVRVKVTCPVIEDGAIGDDPLELSISCDTVLSDDPARPGWQRFDLKQGQTVNFECETVPYDPMWTVRFVPEVESVEAGQ